MITAILFQVMQLYRICKFATEKTVLKVLLPQIEADQYFDDRLRQYGRCNNLCRAMAKAHRSARPPGFFVRG
ncbi:MAG: hypothetical protein PVI69_15240, partial [Desulfobacterales bacterium]